MCTGSGPNELVPSNATAGRQGFRPAGSAPVPSPLTPDKALNSGLYLPFSTGLDWRAGYPVFPHPLEQ